MPGASLPSFHFISTLSDEAGAVTAPIVQARRGRPRAACNLPKVIRPGSGGAGLYFLIYVLFGIVINNHEEKNLPGKPMALSSLQRGFVGINCSFLGNLLT